MADALKNIYTEAFVKQFAAAASEVIEGFKQSAYIKDVFSREWPALELKQRMSHLASNLHKQLSGKYTTDIKTVTALAKAIHTRQGIENSLHYMFLPDYIAQYGIEYPDESLKAMETITILASCEYAVRPFAIRYQDKVLKQMLAWTAHKHASVRRFASEGIRPRLPWAMALPALKNDPAPILPILEVLKNDPSEFVRRSVANNLNDIAKDHPDVVLMTAKKWAGKSQQTDWILKHGCRTLLKKGNNDIMSVFGISGAISCEHPNLKLQNQSLSIGDELHFTFDVQHKEQTSTTLRVDYAIDYVKANGKSNRKVFRITENNYEPGTSYSFKRKQSLKDMTTRKHHKGIHRLSIIVNGNELQSAEFELK